MTRPRLLMIAPAPAAQLPDGRLRLDDKFVEGMRLHAALWDGPVECLLWQGGAIPFGSDHAPGDLGFGLRLLPPGAAITAADLAGAAVIAASADMHQTLGLAPLARAAGARLCYVVEYTLQTRLAILRLDPGLSAPRRLRSALWHLMQERRRRAAFRAADALQVNGYPAEAAYAGLNRNCLLYLDGRMKTAMLAPPAAMAARAAHLTGGGPLRLVHSGRLEPLKGAQDLVPVVRALQARGVDFTLDIFGAGSLAPAIAQGIAEAGLSARVRLHDPLPFESGLVPWVTAHADLFLSCHRQADPSCSYLESMGCGVPVLGYDNAMWRRLAQVSGAGWVRPMARPAALAEAVADLAKDRANLIAAATRARAFAAAHDFETEFARRMAHLAGLIT
ncbi:MAG: glycosyltransferase [Rhodobacteraceae bacterium]|nr:glycosyltransferase [Paracoccaceae bacterium]